MARVLDEQEINHAFPGFAEKQTRTLLMTDKTGRDEALRLPGLIPSTEKGITDFFMIFAPR
jgi:hypothetical protein